MDGQFRSTWDFIGILDAYYGFTMLSLDLTLSHKCISYVGAKFVGKDLLGQWIFLLIRYFKRFRELLKQVATSDVIKNILRDQRSKTYEQMVPKVSRGLFTGLITGLFTLLWRSLTGVSLSLFHMIPVFSLHSRNSHQRCSIRKDVLRDFAKFTGKHLCQTLFFSKVAGLGLQLY